MRLLRGAALPAATFQHEVWHHGRFIARLDAAYPDRFVGIEVDGYAFHTEQAAFERDRTRQNALIALGWRILRFTHRDVVRSPHQVIRSISSVL
jgi:very-short-patch-repair endonuclease